MGLRLLSLPPELLEKVVEGLGQSLIRLWRTGNKTLMWKLSNGGGLREVSLSDLAAGGIARYPCFLDSMVRLEKLTIDVGGSRLCDPEMLWNHLSRLSGLKSLCLNCYEAEEWLLNVEDEIGDLGGLLVDSLSSSKPCEPLPRLRPFAETFEKLETLSMNTPKSVLKDEDIGAFPVSLTSLEVVSSTLLTSDCLRYFRGRDLRVLNTGWSMEINGNEGLEKLPASLTEFRRGTWHGLVLSKPLVHLTALQTLHTAVDPGSLAWLPPSLTHFKWNLGFAPNLTLFDPLAFPHLKHLTFYNYQEIDIANGFPTLPPTLETLELDLRLKVTGGVQRLYAQHPSAQNPSAQNPSAQNPSSQLSSPPLPSPYMTFPTTLQTLLLKLTSGFNVECLQAIGLPPTLTKLLIYHDREQIDGRLLTFLPRSLKTLMVTELTYACVVSPRKPTISLANSLEANPLPPALTALSLFYMGHIDPYQFGVLPRTLTFLACCVSKEVTADDARALPRILTTLSLTFPEQGSCNLSVQALEALPRGVTDLTLTGRAIGITAVWDDLSLAALPPLLTSLSLKGIHLQDESVRLLPSSLTYFSFYGYDQPSSASDPSSSAHDRSRASENPSTSYENPSTSHENPSTSHDHPPSGTDKPYRGSNSPSSGCFVHLPRELRTLKLESTTDIVDGDVAHLPRLIKRLHLCPSHQLKLTLAALPLLPPCLSSFNASSTLNKAFNSAIKTQRNLPFTRFDARTLTNAPSLHNQKY